MFDRIIDKPAFSIFPDTNLVTGLGGAGVEARAGPSTSVDHWDAFEPQIESYR